LEISSAGISYFCQPNNYKSFIHQEMVAQTEIDRVQKHATSTKTDTGTHT